MSIMTPEMDSHVDALAISTWENEGGYIPDDETITADSHFANHVEDGDEHQSHLPSAEETGTSRSNFFWRKRKVENKEFDGTDAA